MKGLDLPDPTDDFSADPVELFFDLAFVFAFSQLVHFLLVNPDWEHVGRAALIFVMLWLPWTQFSWAANAVPGNRRSVRLAFLVATVASVPMAAAVETALDDGGLLFAVPLAVIFAMANALLVVGHETGSNHYRAAVRYAIPNAFAVVCVVGGGFVDGTARVVVWLVAIAIVVVSTVRAGKGEWVLRSGHFAERHGLIIIVALGEVIVALGNAVATPLNDDAGFETSAVVALVATGLCAALLWWSYFDRVQGSLEHRTETLDGTDRGRFARDIYTYLHAPIVAGIILVAVALEEMALHPDEPPSLAFRMMLLGGITLFFGGILAAVNRAFRFLPKERLIAIAALAGVLSVASDVDGVWLIVALDVVLVCALVFEHLRIEVRTASTATTSNLPDQKAAIDVDHNR